MDIHSHSGHAKTTTMDMTSGSISHLLISFAIPLLLGNLFQMLYNTVDTLVVGNFVGKSALAAVGSTSSIINVAVFFFNGVSIGAGVVISRFYGAKDSSGLHTAIETTMAVTLACSVALTALGVLLVPQMLRLMSTPEDVMVDAAAYLRIYFSGISGLLIYNMGSGILRAVGDSKRPLYFLIFSSVLNILLDLFFVIVLKLGIAGVGLATIVSQFLSAALIMYLLMTTQDIYRFTLKEMAVDWRILGQILAIGFPAGIQSMLTAFSNVVVQGYINRFGSDVMAGWSCYNKLNQFVFLPIQSLSTAATTFVSQNVGAQQKQRAIQGTRSALMLSESVVFVIAGILFLFAGVATRFFSPDEAVIDYGVLITRLNVFFILFNCVNHVLAGALRGWGDSKGPMLIMLLTFVGVRQLYLYIGTHLSASFYVVGVAYPVGWVSCCLLETLYYFLYFRRKLEREENTQT